MNPLFSDNFETPYNSIPFNKVKPEHLQPAFEKYFEESRKIISEIIENTDLPDFNNTIVALERSGYKINLLAGIMFNLNLAETNPELQSVTKEMSPLLADFSNEILLNKALFTKIKQVYETTEKSLLDTEDKRLLEKTFDDFARNGANLSDEDKAEYRKISMELAAFSVQFDENVLAETNNFLLHITNEEDLQGLPDDIKTMAAEEAKSQKKEGWVFNLQFPSYMPFMKYANNRKLREKLYMAYATRGIHNNKNNNTEIIKQIVNLRIKKSNLLGYNDYASFVLKNRMAESKEKVDEFLKQLLDASLPKAKQEVKEMQEFSKISGAEFDLQIWDWSFYAEKLKKEKFDIDDEMTRPYFELEKVQNGVMNLATELYGIRFTENKNIPVYQKDVKVFEVFDKDDSYLALLYMDYFPRASKKGGAWMTEYLQQHINTEGENIRPHVSLVFNFSKPTHDKPSLLTFSEVTTLLHEFGHGLHGIFSNCKYQELAGTNVFRDFVELPSQFLENWAEQKEWLEKVASHYETGEKIPDGLVDKIIESRNFNAGYFSMRQLSFGLLDMKWHTLNGVYDDDIIKFETEAMKPTQLLPKVEGTAMSPSFSHIFSGGYAAGYYSYKWSELLDADAFCYFKEKGIFSKELAESFRENILSKGGTEHPMTLYKKFRGKEPGIDALLERSGLK
ncbi:MAG: M3 family metallopeptidase [Bacteroidales bacterium]|nr:M3 family metallopeptidase [Bacteroidales bacterium]MBN2819374.1 M3 family metallopeptidase [Bacteroidales bacterium]